MTVANTTGRTSATGTAVAGQEISFSFPAANTSDIGVRTRLTSTGVQSILLLENSDYTVSLSGDTGGTVTMIDAVADTYTIHVIRATPRTQALDLVAGGAFNPENVEEGFDKLCRIINDMQVKLDRAMLIPVTDSSALDMEIPNSVDRASNFLAYAADGTPTVVSSVAPTTAVITAWIEDNLLVAASAAAARTALGVALGTDVQAYSAYLLAIAALARTNGNFIVGDGTTWVAESGATARTSLGVPADADVVKKDASVAYTSTGVGFRDQDDMLSDDATAPPSQQSLVAYINSIVCHNGAVITHRGNVVTKAATT